MLSYNQLIENHDWLIQKNQKAILSFDVDGWACGLLLQHYLNWDIVGFYDSEHLFLLENTSTKDCVFIDVEIFRNFIRSIGHHLILFSCEHIPSDFNIKTQNCLNPNFIRHFDRQNFYRRKYPFGTFHFLYKILNFFSILNDDDISEDAYSVIFFIDGLFNIFFR